MSDATISSPPKAPPHLASDGLGKALRWSLAAHAAFVLFVVFQSVVFPSKPKPYVPTLRVDMVALPDALKKDLKNLPPAQSQSAKEIADALQKAEADAKRIKPIRLPDAPKEVEPAQPDELVLKPKHASKAQARDTPRPQAPPSTEAREKRLKSALSRIKALSKIQSEERAPRTAVIKGNQISKGSSLSGDAKEAAESSYYDALRARLQENWSLPVWVARQDLSAQVQVFIDSRGKVRSFRFIKTSGNPQFDSAIQKTLEESQPFPLPPSGLEASLRVDGVTVGFPL